jgi:hypothetical protein
MPLLECVVIRISAGYNLSVNSKRSAVFGRSG